MYLGMNRWQNEILEEVRSLSCLIGGSRFFGMRFARARSVLFLQNIARRLQF